MERYFFTKEAYLKEQKFIHYQKKLIEVFKQLRDQALAKEEIFKNWPEYKTLFGTIEFDLSRF